MLIRLTFISIILVLLAGCTGTVAIEPTTTAQPPTVIATETPIIVPPTAISATATLAPLLGVQLPPLPTPTPSEGPVQLPAVWLVVDDQAVLGTPGGFGYTVDLGNGEINSITADAGPPQEFPGLAEAHLPSDTQALVVIDSREIRDVRAAILPWEITGEQPFYNEILAPLFDQPSDELYTFELPPFASSGERLLAISLGFSGPLHENDYAQYYWRLPAP